MAGTVDMTGGWKSQSGLVNTRWEIGAVNSTLEKMRDAVLMPDIVAGRELVIARRLDGEKGRTCRECGTDCLFRSD